MAERISVMVVDLKNSKRDVSMKVIDMSSDSLDEESNFLLSIRKQMTDGLRLYAPEANKLSHRRWRARSELRKLRDQYPPIKDMHEIVASLNGAKDSKNVVIYRSEGKFVGFKIEERDSSLSGKA